MLRKNVNGETKLIGCLKSTDAPALSLLSFITECRKRALRRNTGWKEHGEASYGFITVVHRWSSCAQLPGTNHGLWHPRTPTQRNNSSLVGRKQSSEVEMLIVREGRKPRENHD